MTPFREFVTNHCDMQPQNRRSVVQAGALAPLLEQLSSDNPGVNYHAAQALLAIQ